MTIITARKDALSKVDETMEDYWDIIGGGCSWYCGGGPKRLLHLVI